MPAPYNPLGEFLRLLLIELPLAILRPVVRLVFGSSSRGAERRAAHAIRKAEREARQQRREWFDAVERQKTRGDAGDATQDEAIEALRGRGGRSNPLDERKFR